ncbi:hypothetical protein [Thermanaerovibrio acidaminovorans]|uniref:hypothetical protein n=1 Tax=Thermanaerovibrio acidaminovorans TaxID=81462 RepID=UPI002490DEA6|nr:hypothetical protein [Thermanaerovibrio acidaminovorans]
MERLYHLDRLRVWCVYGVVALHGAMTYADAYLKKLICSLERSFSGKMPKNPLIYSHERKVQKTAQDINPSGSGHVETVCLMSRK